MKKILYIVLIVAMSSCSVLKMLRKDKCTRKIEKLEKEKREIRKCLIWILMHLKEGTIRTELSINTIEEVLDNE